jgi:hypothetical protein
LPEVPPLGVHLWIWWRDLHATRQSTGMGPTRLTRAEIRQWEADEFQPLSHWERSVIMAIDAEWFAITCEQQAKRNSEGKTK